MKRKIQNTIFFIQFVFTKLCILDLPTKGMNKKGGRDEKIDFFDREILYHGTLQIN